MKDKVSSNCSKQMKAPILITGCARSGTSMVAGIVNICGAYGGDMSGPTRNNPKGMFENAKIRNNIVKPYYQVLGVDRLGQYPLPDINQLPIPPNWKDRVEGILRREGYTDGAWFYKGAKMTQHWPVWHYAFPEAKWVIVRRKSPDIVRSCIRTGFMRAFNKIGNQRAVGAQNEQEGWMWWIHQHEARWQEMKKEGLRMFEVWPERMVDGDYSQVEEMITWLELDWKEQKVRDFIDPKLYKSRIRKNK